MERSQNRATLRKAESSHSLGRSHYPAIPAPLERGASIALLIDRPFPELVIRNPVAFNTDECPVGIVFFAELVIDLVISVENPDARIILSAGWEERIAGFYGQVFLFKDVIAYH